jgi:hypothetical protein
VSRARVDGLSMVDEAPTVAEAVGRDPDGGFLVAPE